MGTTAPRGTAAPPAAAQGTQQTYRARQHNHKNGAARDTIAAARKADLASLDADGAAQCATIGDSHRPDLVTVTRRLLVFFALVAGLAAACGLTWSVSWQRGIEALRLNAAARADRTTSALRSTL